MMGHVSKKAIRELWAGVLNALPDPVFIHDHQFKIIDANQEYLDLCGMSRSAILNKPYWEVFPKHTGALPSCLRALISKDEEHEEISDDNETYYLCRSFPVFDDNEQYSYSVTIFEDITSQHQIELKLRESEAKLHALTVSINEAILLTDPKGKILFWNDAATQLFGYKSNEMMGLSFHEFLVNKNHIKLVKKGLSDLAHQGKSHFLVSEPELEFKHKDGEIILIQLTAAAAPLEDNWHALITLRDITSQKQGEQEVGLDTAIFKAASEGIFITDSNNKIIEINPAFSELTGYEREEIIGQDPKVLGSGKHNKNYYHKMWQALKSHGKWHGEIWNRHKNGELYPYWMSIVVLRDQPGKVLQYVGILTDITERKAAEATILRQANFDALTDVPNRRCFHDRLNHAIAHAKRNHDHMSLLFLDLDHFKEVNDEFGHQTGDEIIKQASQRLIDCVRESDTVARLGGDEFALILSTISNSQDSKLVAKKIVSSLAEPYQVNGNEINLSASVGIATYPEDSQDPEDLIRFADMAMYWVKQHGRNDFSLYTPACQGSLNV